MKWNPPNMTKDDVVDNAVKPYGIVLTLNGTLWDNTLLCTIDGRTYIVDDVQTLKELIREHGNRVPKFDVHAPESVLGKLFKEKIDGTEAS